RSLAAALSLAEQRRPTTPEGEISTPVKAGRTSPAPPALSRAPQGQAPGAGRRIGADWRETSPPGGQRATLASRC
ncbi:hypothetical protein P7K49_025988, partial [Saguinus oedipus]